MSDIAEPKPGEGKPAETKKVRRLAAIVFSDVVSYSARMQVDEAGTLALVQADFEAMGAACAHHGGQVLKSTGDGLLMCFDSVVDAVTAALAIQAGFIGRGEGALQHRIGVHLGDVYHQNGDVVGDGVNIAARLQAAGKPGAICVSDVVFAAVSGKVAMDSQALGPLTLKNIAQPMAATLIAPPGALPAAARKRGPNRRTLFTAAAAVVLIAGALATWRFMPGAAGSFSRYPDLQRARTLIYALGAIPADFALADDIVKPLLGAHPNDPEVVTVAAEVAEEYIVRGFDLSQPRRAAAQALTERAAQLAPDNPDALSELAVYLMSSGGAQAGRAEELARRAVAINPKEPRFYRRLYATLERSKPAEADAFGQQMVALFPEDPLAPYELFRHYLGTRSLPDLLAAEQWLDKSLAVTPVSTAISWKAQYMLQVHGDAAAMASWMAKVPERERSTARMINTYAVVAEITGQTEDMRRLLNSINDAWLNDGGYIFPKAMLAGDVAALDKQTDVARIQYEAALKDVRALQSTDPTDTRYLRAELWIQLGLGDTAAARAALRINQQLAPKPYRWTMNMVWWSSSLRAEFLLGERAEAMTHLKEAAIQPVSRLLLRNLMNADPKMAPFRDDPEVVALLADPKT